MKFYFLLFFFLILSGCEVVPPKSIYRPVSPKPAPVVNENAEFANLLEKDLINKKRSNAEVLTYLLNDPDPNETHTAAVFENTSSCNIIVRMVDISNQSIYNFPVSARSKNQFVIKKGNYTLRSKICIANYYSQKNITEPLILKLSSN